MLRDNARRYRSRGVQLAVEWSADAWGAQHDFEFGARVHEDYEDRLQRNGTYTQAGGELVVADVGVFGNAGNRIQSADAVSLYFVDRVDLGRFEFRPGVRVEDIDLARTRYETRDGLTADPASRAAANLWDERSNNIRVVIPGIGALYELTDNWSVFGGVHRGFTTPGNSPGADEETSVNYELGLRGGVGNLAVDAVAFLTDYDNLLGVCTVASGADCEPGDAFNGDAASIRGLELSLRRTLTLPAGTRIPLGLTYTYLDGQFDNDIASTDFFGDVQTGDPLPYIPEQQWQLAAGLERGPLAAYANLAYVGDTCVRASCGPFERTESATTLDLSVHYALGDRFSVYGRVDNVTNDDSVLGRHPYGARPGRSRSIAVGVRASL